MTKGTVKAIGTNDIKMTLFLFLFKGVEEFLTL